MVQEIRDEAITPEMMFIKITVAILIKIQHKGIGELKVKSSASDARVGHI